MKEEFGKLLMRITPKAWVIALRILKNSTTVRARDDMSQLAQDIVSTVYTRFLENEIEIYGNFSFRNFEGYFLKSVINETKQYLRKEHGKVHYSISIPELKAEDEIDVTERAWSKLENSRSDLMETIDIDRFTSEVIKGLPSKRDRFLLSSMIYLEYKSYTELYVKINKDLETSFNKKMSLEYFKKEMTRIKSEGIRSLRSILIKKGL